MKNKIKKLPYTMAKLGGKTIMFLLKVIVNVLIIYPLNALNALTHHLDFRYKKDTVYCLIIINIVIWSVTYVNAGTFWKDYINFLPGGTITIDVVEAKKETKKEIKKEVESQTIRTVTAYNVGDLNQCSGDPCISANGENICEALERGYKRCAANFVPFGTMLEIEHYGICLVTDRLNSRYPNRVDIAMKFEEKQRALKFGKQNLVVKILK